MPNPIHSSLDRPPPRRRGRWRLPALLLVLLAALALPPCTATGRAASAPAAPAIPPTGPTVRVGVIRDAANLRVMAYGAFDIMSSADRVVFTCPGTSVLRLEAVGGERGTFYYYTVVADYDPKDKALAHQLLGQLRQILKVGMEVLESSPHLTRPKDRTPGERLLVAVGPFDDLALAEQWKDYLLQAYPAYIVRDTSKRATGEIHLYDGHNQLLARMKDSLFFRTKDPSQTLSVDALPSTSGNWAMANRTRPRFRGQLEIRLNDEGHLTATDVVSLEEYVKGVVPSEIGGLCPLEALKAQAVAARSEALFKLRLDRHPGQMYDFCDTTHCQVYRGLDDQTGHSARWVEETAGQVLVNGAEVVDAVYSHSCGGVTASSADIWRGSKYTSFRTSYDGRAASAPNLADERAAANWLNSQPDVFCNCNQPGFPEYAKKYFRWSREVTGATLRRNANARKKIGDVTGLRVTDRAASGRARELTVTGTGGTLKIVGAYEIADFLGELPSAFIVLQPGYAAKPPRAIERLTIRGGGFGHGVGMCQMGAMSMAQHGYKYDQILRHYYPTAAVRKAY